MRKSGVAEKYVGVVQDMHESWKTMNRCDRGVGGGAPPRIGSEPLLVCYGD